jgi:adenine-specific DNA-methyltransferase
MPPEHMPLETTDPKTLQLQALQAHLPELFADGQLSLERFKTVFAEELETSRERFGLSWAGKSDALRALQHGSTGTLRPLRAESLDFETTQNAIIEGDNLEVLKLLQKSYHNQIKLIYIDPPYNTGQDFVYPDNFTEGLKNYLQLSGQIGEEGNKLTSRMEANGRRHSKWLTMMYPRLHIAKTLLKDDGVIFISIDDNEVHHLRMLMDEIFGEENFVAMIPWRKRTMKNDVPFGISQDYETVLMYAKSQFLAGKEVERRYFQTDDYTERWRTADLTKQTTKDDRPNSFFDLVNPKNNQSYPANPKRVWSITPETFPDFYARGKVIFPGDYDFLKIKAPVYRVFESEDREKSLKKFGDDIARSAVSTHLPKEIGMSEDGSSELYELFGDSVFSFPKPSSLIRYLINFSTKPDTSDIILDFFAGSGTTAQAVLEQNQTDNGNRRFVLVQIPEPTPNANFPTIASVTRERVRRVGAKIRHSQNGALPLEDAPDLGFRAFGLDSSNFKVWDANTPDLAGQLAALVQNVVDGRSREDILFELLLKSGLPLSSRVEVLQVAGQEVYSVSSGQLLICLERPILPNTLRGMIAQKPAQVLCLDVAFEGDDALKTNIVLEMRDAGILFRTV